MRLVFGNVCNVFVFFTERYSEILEDLKKDPESHGGPPDCIVSSKNFWLLVFWLLVFVAVVISSSSSYHGTFLFFCLVGKSSFFADFVSKSLGSWGSRIYLRKSRWVLANCYRKLFQCILSRIN